VRLKPEGATPGDGPAGDGGREADCRSAAVLLARRQPGGASHSQCGWGVPGARVSVCTCGSVHVSVHILCVSACVYMCLQVCTCVHMWVCPVCVCHVCRCALCAVHVCTHVCVCVACSVCIYVCMHTQVEGGSRAAGSVCCLRVLLPNGGWNQAFLLLITVQDPGFFLWQ
jgi:hypothetical protein